MEYSSPANLNPRHLRYLEVIADTGSFLAAAKVLNIAQPSLSVSIARMEDVVGEQLVTRGRHGAQLTEAGLIMVRHARGLNNALENALTEIRASAKGVNGPLIIGGTPLATANFIPEILSRLVQDFGPIRCRVVEAMEEELLAGLSGHEIELAISSMQMPHVKAVAGDIASEPLFTATTSAVVRRGHVFASRGSVSLRDLQSALWVLPPHGSVIRSLIDAVFLVAGVPLPENLIEAAPFGVLKEIVKRSDGVTILSDQIVRSELAEGSLITIPLAEQITRRVFGIHRLSMRILSPIAMSFVTAAKDLSADLA
jgi:molybdate transport repressor ModE-like protein